MQERKVLIARVIKSARVLPTSKDTPQERISKFVEAQKQVVAYPFSPELSVKALGQALKNNKDPSADNKEKRKKAESNFTRIGVAVFDPDATPKKGQYFEIRPRKVNQDGQLGDVPNVGWLDPRKTVKPEDLVNQGKKFLASKKGPSVRKVPAKKNPRTGQMEVKALGRTIGRAAGNIGQAAARAAGVLVDADGKFRCPPGVPAANQFTDEVGSNCFDFSPLVARALVKIAEKFGHQMMEKLSKVNNATPFERNDDYQLVLRSSGGRLRGTVLGPEKERLRGTLLGPDGKPIPPTPPPPPATPIEPFDLIERELEIAERDLARIAGSGEIIDPDTYEEKFEEAFRAAYPELTDEEIKSLAKIASERERMRDKLRAEQRSALDLIRSLGIDVDESDPVSVQRGIALALLKMKEMGWDIDLDSYFGEGFSENPERALLAYRNTIANMALDGTLDAVRQGIIHGMSPADLEVLQRKYGSKFEEMLVQGIVDGSNPSEIFPDDEKAQQLLAMGQRSLAKAQQFETGTLLQLINARQENPELTQDIKSIVHVAYDPSDPFFGGMSIDEKGNLQFQMNLGGMLLLHPAASLSDSDSFLYEPTGTAGTEIEKLKRIGEVVSAENRHRLLDSYMGGLTTFAEQISKIRNGEGYMTQSLNDSFGGMALGQFVAFHELTHGRQLSMAREIIKSRNPGMSNSEAMALLGQMIFQGRKFTDSRGVDFDYGTMITDPQVMLTACANMREIVHHLIDNKVGGTYGPSHYYSTFYLNEVMSKANNYSDVSDLRDSLVMRKRELEAAGKNEEDAEYKGLIMAIGRIDGVLASATDDEDALLKMRRQVNEMAQVTYLEMQADLSAAVKFGLIKETPEIKAFLAPLSLGQDLPEIKKNIVPPPPPAPPGPPPTRRDKLRELAGIGKRARKISMMDLRDMVEGIADIDEATDKTGGLSAHDRTLMSAGMASAAKFDSRGSASRWGKQVRDAVLRDMTEKHREVLESEWRELFDVKNPIAEDGTNQSILDHRLIMGGVDDSWLSNEIENGFIPLVEVVGESKLPNSVAAEIVIPGGAISEFGEEMKGRRIEIRTHFTGVIKSDDNLGSSDSITNPIDNQRLIVAVPEGYSGLPDYTPGTDKSEIGSIILPPGEIEIVGVRDDGVAIGRVTSQRSADDIIDAKRQELKAFDDKKTDIGEKITVRKAINRLERQQETRRLSALRSAGNTARALPDEDRTKLPSAKSSKTRDVLERLNAVGIKFGISSKKDRERKRKERLSRVGGDNARVGMSVRTDTYEFESPEESQVRVSKSIDRAVELIKEGKLPGLAPEVAEIMKDKSPEEIRAILVASARSFVDGLDKRPRFRVRGTRVRDVKDAREIPLLGFLKTGVYKTTYDADATGVAAASDVGRRAEYEILLGLPEGADESLRPAHGFMTHRDQIEFEDEWAKAQIDAAEKRSPNAVSFRDPSVIPPASGSNNKLKDADGKLRAVDSLPYQYGDSEIVLRTDAANRSVGTMGDSLNGFRTPFQLDGSSTDDELLESFILNRGSAADKGDITASEQRRIANLLNAAVGKNHAHTTDWTEDGGVPQRDYVEAVVAGSFDMSDVEEIKISKGFQDAEIMPFAKVDAQNVGGDEVVELLQDVLPQKDIDEVKKLISSPQTDPDKKRLAEDIKQLIAARLQLVRERSGRRQVRARVAQHSSDGNVPKVTFLNPDGINIDDPRTFKRTMDAVGMGEEHEIDDIVKYATAKAIRERLSGSGISVDDDASFAALKPKPVISVANNKPALRSSGAATPKTRTQILSELTSSGNKPDYAPIGSRSLQMMDEAKKRREELSQILDSARMITPNFEEDELSEVLNMADKTFAWADEELIASLRQLRNRPGLSDAGRKKIDRALQELQQRKKEFVAAGERGFVPGIRRSGADKSRRLARRSESAARRMESGDPAQIARGLRDIRSARMSAEGRENTTRIAQNQVIRGSGSRSAFRTRGVGASLRSSGATRSVDDKLSEGPRNLQYGTDSQNLPRVATADELEKRFGNSTKAHRKYFRQYGVKLVGNIPDDPVERETYYASLQALDDLFKNVDHKQLLKGLKFKVRVNSFVTKGGEGPFGEFSRVKRIFADYGKDKIQMSISTDRITKNAKELHDDSLRYRFVDPMTNQMLSSFVNRLYISPERLKGSNGSQEEIARRLAYACAVHEFGHFLDFAAVRKEDRTRMRSLLGEGVFGERDLATEELGAYRTARLVEQLNQMPSVSSYGVSSPQEKLAEAFTAWFLFSKRPDIAINGDLSLSDKERSQPISGTIGGFAKPVVELLLEELGPRVKSAKQNKNDDDDDDLPPLVAMYALFPFIMIEDGGKA